MAYQPARAKYLPPKARVNQPIISISSDNFPEFGTVQSPAKPVLNFKSQVLAAEEERRKANDPLCFDSTQTNRINREKRIEEGWAILPFTKGKVGFISEFDVCTPPVKYEIDLFMESLNLSTFNIVK